jgi:hypothetical protein
LFTSFGSVHFSILSPRSKCYRPYCSFTSLPCAL